MNTKIPDNLKYLDSISLEELNAYKLFNRIDTKYICKGERLNGLLEKCIKNFKAQEINGSRIFSYESLYFDTPQLKTYFDHHQGKRIRFKIRYRKYLNTGDVFLEVKKKRNYIRTNKSRTEIPFSSSLDKPHYDFIENYIDLPELNLVPTIWTIFDRITLVGKEHFERITIDTNLRFKRNNKEVILPGLSIIEVKREKTDGISPFSKILHDFGIKPCGFSKYIMGNIALNPQIKHNRFKRRIKTVNKICYDT